MLREKKLLNCASLSILKCPTIARNESPSDLYFCSKVFSVRDLFTAEVRLSSIVFLGRRTKGSMEFNAKVTPVTFVPVTCMYGAYEIIQKFLSIA